MNGGQIGTSVEKNQRRIVDFALFAWIERLWNALRWQDEASVNGEGDVSGGSGAVSFVCGLNDVA